MIAGNEKVVNARLSDAMFFYEQDTRESLHSKTDRLKQVVFQKDLGSIYDKTQRIKCLSEYLCKYTKADIKKTQRASELCKTDLITDMVNEFPDLQGRMGGTMRHMMEKTKQCQLLSRSIIYHDFRKISSHHQKQESRFHYLIN